MSEQFFACYAILSLCGTKAFQLFADAPVCIVHLFVDFMHVSAVLSQEVIADACDVSASLGPVVCAALSSETSVCAYIIKGRVSNIICLFIHMNTRQTAERRT
jgi:hypothetical protein